MAGELLCRQPFKHRILIEMIAKWWCTRGTVHLVTGDGMPVVYVERSIYICPETPIHWLLLRCYNYCKIHESGCLAHHSTQGSCKVTASSLNWETTTHPRSERLTAPQEKKKCEKAPKPEIDFLRYWMERSLLVLLARLVHIEPLSSSASSSVLKALVLLQRLSHK